MSQTWTTKRGDTRKALVATLYEPDGTAANLTDTTVRFLMTDRRKASAIDREVDVTDGENGKVRVVFEPADVAAAGYYMAEFEAEFPDGRKETYPNDGYLQIHIVPDLD